MRCFLTVPVLAATSLLEAILRDVRDGAESGEDSEGHGDERNGGERKEEHRGVERDVFKARKIRGSESDEHAQTRVGEKNPENSTEQRKEERFREELANQTRERSAESGADSQFPFAAGGLSKQEIGDVGASDQ